MLLSRRTARLLLTVTCLAAALTACAGSAGPPRPGPTAAPSAQQSTPTAAPSPTPLPPTPEPAPTGTPTAAPAVTATAPPAVGPEDFPPGVNPLTGLAVGDPAVLARRPLIVKVSNQSDEVRPQSGLSFADHVWLYQAEGWRQTRIAAVYYSQAPEVVGSVRSARPIDEHLVDMYGGLLVISGASKDVYRILMNAPWWRRVLRDDQSGHLVRLPDTPREGVGYTHTLFAVPEVAWQHADERGVNGAPELRGLRFDAAPPPGGEPTSEVSVDYPEYGPQQTWRYDEESGRWLSWTQMQLDLPPHESLPDVDYLTGEQLAFDNVVILWVHHAWREDFVEVPALGVDLFGAGEAVLLRDGQRYDVTWRRSAPDELLRLVDRSGAAVALKPGTTWFHVASAPDDEYTPAVMFGAGR